MLELKTVSPAMPPPFKILADLAATLNLQATGANALKEPLKLASHALGAGAAALYRRRYISSGEFDLECLGHWSQSTSGIALCPQCFKREKASEKFWAQINSADAGLIDSSDPNLSGTVSDLFILPLSFEKKPFGFILFFEINKKVLKRMDADYIRALCHIFELWICNLNIRKRFADVIDFIPSPAFIMTTDERVVVWNKANEEMTGWKAEQLIDRDGYESSVPYYFIRRPMVANLIMKPDPDWEKTYFEFVREGDTVHSFAFCPALPGGGAYLRTKTLRLYDANHRLWGAIHAVRDVTLERRMRENLQRSESMYRAISDFAGVGILLFKDDQIVYFNEQILDFMGTTRKEISHKDFIRWIYPEDRNRVKKFMTGLFKDKPGPARIEFRAQNRGDLRHYNVSAQLIIYEDQSAVHLIIDDITEQKEIDRKERLKEVRLYHEGRLASLGVMAAGLAHELNQPLNTIRVITDGYLFGKEEGWAINADELFKGLEMISRQVVRMSQVINNVRNFAREDRDPELVDINVNEAVENVFSMIGRQLEAHDIHVTKELAPDLPAVKAHLNRLEQVVMNLLVNSRQAHDLCADKAKSLWIKTGSLNGSVFIEIGDNATGIPEHSLGKIFDPFFTTKEANQGTGLGLSISRSIVSEFKGEIRAFNNDRGGATFIVTAPLAGGAS